MGDNGTVSTALSRVRKPDAVCAEAVDTARAAVTESDPDCVGAYLGHRADDARVVTHDFEATMPGYQGWHWAVTVTRAPRSKRVTVSEVVLLPGDEAVLSPEWLPWNQRLLPGDLGVGDLLVTAPDDPRLQAGYTETGDDVLDELTLPAGFGRERVLSQLGRDEAAQRWYDGDQGPGAKIAKAAPAGCSSCGFFLPLAGRLAAVFGVCGNEFAPDDGGVVSFDHGCGAHSQAVVQSQEPQPAPEQAAIEPAAGEQAAEEVTLEEAVLDEAASPGGADEANAALAGSRS